MIARETKRTLMASMAERERIRVVKILGLGDYILLDWALIEGCPRGISD